MMRLENFIRENILRLKPYSSARDEFHGSEGVFLDANENPFGAYNRYPDPYQSVLKQKVSEIKEVSPQNIFIGNGSDEVIDLVLRIFCEPTKDSIIICPPTYGMYSVSAEINNINILEIPLSDDFELNVDEILNTEAKVLFICSPNNPTANVLKSTEYVIQHFNGIVVLDEAYIDFSTKPSLLFDLNKYPNLIISQTLSKAYGMAGLRLGLAFASEEMICYFNKVKPPYNVSSTNQETALEILNQTNTRQQIEQILSEKQKLIEAFSEFNFVKKIFPSDTNFLLVETTNANKIYDELIKQKIIIRNRNSLIDNCLRITVGTPQENQQLISALKQITI